MLAELHYSGRAVPEDTEITMTEYVKGAKVEGDHASLSTINCTPDGLEFGKDVEVGDQKHDQQCDQLRRREAFRGRG